MKENLLAFFDPSRSILLFIVGTSTLTLGLQALYDFANAPGEFKGGYLLAILSLMISAGVLVYSWRRGKVKGKIEIQEEYKPEKRKGLILLASPSKKSAPDSINYHLPELTHCWVLSTTDSMHTAQELNEQFGDRINIYWGSPNYLVNPDQIESTYNIILEITKEAINLGLSQNDLIADITGGTKPMTTGMGLACLARNIDMEYMKSSRDKYGDLIENRSEPIRIDTRFIPTGE